MAIIITRASKGSALTNAELDQNLVNLNTEITSKASATNITGTVSVPSTGALAVTTNSMPSIRPSLLLDFVNSNRLDPRVTFTRASTATRTNDRGLLESVTTSTPRFDYDPTTLACRGLLIEEQRTNLLTYSEQFDNAAWGKTNIAVTANTAVAPNETHTADTLDFTNASAFMYQTYNPSVNLTGVTFVFSVWLASATKNKVAIRVVGTTTGTGGETLVTLTPTLTRYSVAVTIPSGNVAVLAGFENRTFLGGDGLLGTIQAWGAQLETGAYATSYIPSVVNHTGRASTATYINSAGVLSTAATGVARYEYSPKDLTIAPYLLLEESRTNSIRNNMMVGAVAGTPGTLPTDWTDTVNPGLTRSIISVGPENGISYIDVKISGTTVNTGVQWMLSLVLGNQAVPATSGQTWNFSSYIALKAGTMPTTPYIRLVERNSAGSYVIENNYNFNTATASLINNRFNISRTMGTDTGYVTPNIYFFTAGGYYDWMD